VLSNSKAVIPKDSILMTCTLSQVMTRFYIPLPPLYRETMWCRKHRVQKHDRQNLSNHPLWCIHVALFTLFVSKLHCSLVLSNNYVFIQNGKFQFYICLWQKANVLQLIDANTLLGLNCHCNLL
jgi:hypothetical protein